MKSALQRGVSRRLVESISYTTSTCPRNSVETPVRTYHFILWISTKDTLVSHDLVRSAYCVYHFDSHFIALLRNNVLT